jgi:type IV secretory pathway TrbD component
MEAQLFPDTVSVPRGLATDRMILGVPPWVFVLLLMLAVGPLYLWGRSTWWIALLALGCGWLVALVVRDDPSVLSAWMSELRLKDYYE